MKKTLLMLLAVAVGLAIGVASCEASSDPPTPVNAANAPQTLTGLFTLPDGSLLNGEFTIGLVGATFKNICVSPYQVVPSKSMSYKVVNGAIQGISAAAFTSTDCLTPRLPYVVSLADSTNATIYKGNWDIPRVQGNTTDVGDMGVEGLQTSGGSPINVAIPLGIISTPSQSQTITQPSGTSFTFIGAVNFDGPVVFEDGFTFNQIIATQVLVGGITSSTYPLDVQGIIDATGGYAVGGSGGTLGQCLVSNGTAFVAGTCTQGAIPTTYFQNVQLNGSNQPIAHTLNLNGSMTASVDPVNSILSLTLTQTGPGNYLASVASPLTGSGCAQGTGDGGFALLSAPCLTGSTMTSTVLTGSRALSTVYQNTGTSPMFVKVVFQHNSSGTGSFYVGTTNTYLTLVDACSITVGGGENANCNIGDFVPPGSYYKAMADSPTLAVWVETQF